MKATLIFLLLSLHIICSAQLKPKFAFDWFPLSNGNFTSNYNPVTNSNVSVNEGNFRVRVGGEYKIWKITSYFDMQISMLLKTNITSGGLFVPTQNKFYFGFKIDITKSVKMRLEHLCIHPIITANESLNQQFGGYDMISVSYNYD